MKKRFIALLLCCVMLLTLSPSLISAASADDVAAASAVTVTPEAVKLPQNERVNERVTLTASAQNATSYQWQIKAGENVWVDISGEKDKTISVSYAMVASLLNGKQAQLRCKTDTGVSNAVTVTVTEPKVEPKAESQTDSQPALFSAPARSGLKTETVVTESQSAQEPVVYAAGETPATYNVVINYAFENGSIAADPYTANLAAGSSFSASVTFPIVQGYLPYVGETQQNSIDLNYTAIDQDQTINVVYKPTNVDYTVIHYQQNLNDDNYTEAERETKQGLTNSTVPEVAKNYEGFYALLYEKPAIAADGSTVVEVYYDRYYYLMNFDLDGGYGVEPIYARYGAPISGVGTPTKAGYSFGGWSLDGTNVVKLPGTMPAENRTYKAVWTADATAKVTVVFWGENADDEEYSYIRSMQIDAKPGESYSFDGSTVTCPLAEHNHNNCKLVCTHTTHTLDCYSTNNGFFQTTKPSQVLTNEGNGIYTYETDYYYYTTTHYYLNIGDDWYCGTKWLGNKDDTQSITFSCPHTHTDECYDCGQIVHTHGSACSGLWTFVKSDTVTVAADGSSVVNVYYDRTEKTLTFKYDYQSGLFGGSYKKTETITAKWGSNISEQYKKIAANAGSTFWSADINGSSPYTNYFGVMPQTNATYYNRGDSGSTGTMTYWGQDQNGEYTVKLFEVTGVGGYYVSDEDRYEFEGFTYHHGTENDEYCAGANFYYTRNSYTLTFNDGYKDAKTESVKYEAPLSTYKDYVPAVPSAYEPGSVVFGGWYLNPECTGAEYKLNEHTMPADNVLLYAKWEPVSHYVYFYLDKAAYENEQTLESHPVRNVPHGSLATPTPADPTNGSYSFVGWFYMEDGVEKAFDFANMPVNKDLKVYGKWSSNVLKQYTVYYKIQGTDTEIADPTTGSGLAGITKTFEAKGGTDLYADYQEGYFPVTKSHSMTLDINATEENNTNVYTFWYVQKEAVPYTVKYVTDDTDVSTEWGKVTIDGKQYTVVAKEKTVSDNRKAVVTETFVPVSGMMPDAYQKRLVVSAEDGAVNEIIFYYVKDAAHAYYKITHYTENLNGGTWTEYASSQIVGNVGMTDYSADPMSIPGFTYQKTEYVVNGGTPSTIAPALTTDGLEINLYYTRNSYPYQVRYLEQGTGKQLADPKNGTGKYGEVVSESAIDIENYDAVAPTSQTLNIRIEEGTVAKLNIITFYYKEKEVTINYQVVGPDGCGTVSPTSETLKVLSGTAQGSTPTANDDFRFVGWFTDAACTQTVTDANGSVVGTKFTPAKVDGKNVAATYYAKFEYDITDLTITKEVTGYIDNNQSFVFNVKGGDVDIDVVIHGAGRVTIEGLKVGTTYTVTEKTDWSWRYEQTNVDKPNGEITLVAGEGINEIKFTNELENPYWLSGNTYRDNRWGTIEAVLQNIDVIV